jgi:putative cardiolipin synthase
MVLLRTLLLVVVAWSAAATAADLAASVSAAADRHPGLAGVLLLDTGAEALEQREALVAAAKLSIDAQYYIWNSDASGRYLAGQLLAAARRGVRVRVVLDDINSGGRDAVFAALAAEPNVEIRIYNPNRVRQGAWRVAGLLRDFDRVNRRMHNKSFTVDGAVTIVGGRNIGDEYFDLDPEMNFRDRELLAVGPVVADARVSFDAFWTSPLTRPVEKLAAGEEIPDRAGIDAAIRAASTEMKALGHRPLRDAELHFVREALPHLDWASARLLFDPPPTRAEIEGADRASRVALALESLLASGKREVLVESAYFIPGDASLQQARVLREQGVTIRALTNSLASNDLVTNHSGYAKRRIPILKAGIELHELRPDAPACVKLVRTSIACRSGPAFSLHSKSAVVDRRTVYVGSFNLNLRSAYLNSETAMIVESPALATRIAESIDELMLPVNSWRVERSGKGALRWVSQSAGRETVDVHEPMSSAWRRFQSRLYRLVPMEKYL